ncbi:MAG: transposase zinc-binding domain-containing protein [Patescibacteria group bacterium]|nr:transposase zinc-binding domain-containing protein [Patescibacteria group bacterium]
MLEAIKAGGNYTIKQILKDSWNDFYDLNNGNIRDVVFENIEKVMACGDKDKLGYGMYVCPSCGDKHYVAHTCKSRFCNSCGKIMTDNWINWAQENMLNCPYHHIIFSPPSELWLFFAANRDCLNFLFKATSDAIIPWCKKQ